MAIFLWFDAKRRRARIRESILASIRDADVTGQITSKARSSRMSSRTLSRIHFEGIGTLS
jgi:hypothetical protein